MTDVKVPIHPPGRRSWRAPTWMRTIGGLLLAVALLAATPSVALADTYPSRTAGQQQVINYVITRALSQTGIPYTYGGGDASGPTLGIGEPDTSADVSPSSAAPESDSGDTVTGLGQRDRWTTSDAAAEAGRSGEQGDVVGFDASGLMVYSFAGAGLKLPRSSGEQYKAGRKIAPALALPGDLIFYGPEGRDSVAMFLGNARMLEVGDSGVAVSPVRTADMTPYLARYIG